ncbi:MAG TPA: hypothetical protein VK568_06630 [Thermodesulfobacteriota bacterium]|nr:hypothetical protein [Thermodesulfobacteriota bacterium]
MGGFPFYSHTEIEDFFGLIFYDILRIRHFHRQGLKRIDDVIAVIPLFEEFSLPY